MKMSDLTGENALIGEENANWVTIICNPQMFQYKKN